MSVWMCAWGLVLLRAGWAGNRQEHVDRPETSFVIWSNFHGQALLLMTAAAFESCDRRILGRGQVFPSVIFVLPSILLPFSSSFLFTFPPSLFPLFFIIHLSPSFFFPFPLFNHSSFLSFIHFSSFFLSSKLPYLFSSFLHLSVYHFLLNNYTYFSSFPSSILPSFFPFLSVCAFFIAFLSL